MRCRSNRPNGQFAAIPNEAMRDTHLSIEARGILALLMTCSDERAFKTDPLKAITGIGRDKFRGVMRELRSAGYVIRPSLGHECGTVSGSMWMILDDPSADAETEKTTREGDAGTDRLRIHHHKKEQLLQEEKKKAHMQASPIESKRDPSSEPPRGFFVERNGFGAKAWNAWLAKRRMAALANLGLCCQGGQQ